MHKEAVLTRAASFNYILLGKNLFGWANRVPLSRLP